MIAVLILAVKYLIHKKTVPDETMEANIENASESITEEADNSSETKIDIATDESLEENDNEDESESKDTDTQEEFATTSVDVEELEEYEIVIPEGGASGGM